MRSPHLEGPREEILPMETNGRVGFGGEAGGNGAEEENVLERIDVAGKEHAANTHTSSPHKHLHDPSYISDSRAQGDARTNETATVHRFHVC